MNEHSVYVISLTPFDAQGRLDEPGLRAHLGRLRDAGIGVYVAGGGSGEGYTLTPDEVRRVLAIAVEELRGRVPVRFMGVEPRTAEEMCERARWAQDAGVDGMQIYSLDAGHDVKPTPAMLDRYLTAVLDSVDLPCVLSSHFSVGYFLPLDLIERMLTRYPHVVGVNCTNPDVSYLVDLVGRVRGRAEVHVGGPMQALSALALGATGYLCSEGNLAPRLCQSLVDRYEAGDVAGAHEAYAQVIRLFTCLRRYTGITGAKAALQLLGLPGGHPRPPRLAVDPAEHPRLAADLAALQIQELEGLA